MGKSAPTPPPPPDPVKTANAQGAINREAAIANQEMSMVNQLTPFGNLTYSRSGTSAAGNPTYTATQTLSPDQQRIADLSSSVSQQFGQAAQNQLSNVQGTLSKPIDYSSLGDPASFDTSSLGAAPTVNEATRTAARDAILARINPQMENQRAALETSLANQGFVTGSQGWNRAMDESNRARNDAYLAADAMGGDEMARMYGIQSAGRQQRLNELSQQYRMDANARDRAINEMIQQRQIPLNELSAMMSGNQVQGPKFVNAPGANMAAADLMGATYGSANLANQNYQQQVAAQNANTQGLYGLLGTGLKAGAYAFSDRRLKTGITKIGNLANGLAVYTYRYIWGGPEQVGLMADEVKKLKPWAVKSFGGFDAVNYVEAVK